MNQASLMSSVLAMGLLWGGLSVAAGERSLTDAEYERVGHAKTIYMDIAFSTWMPRGKSLADVAPSLRTSLASAGFTVVRNPTDPHELTLKVDYREGQGKQYKFDMYGTDITCVIQLEHPEFGSLLNMTIRESSANPESGTPPYLETLQRFQTNPYFYFLGDIIKGFVVSRRDTTGSLIESLQRLQVKEEPKIVSPIDELPSAASTLPTFETLYAGLAREKTIQELGRLQDPRAVPVLIALLEHSDPSVRLASVRALESIREAKSRPALERLAKQDLDHDVRAAAKAAIDTLPGF